MIERLNSLRVWLIAAMLATAVVAILVGNLVIDRINERTEMTADRAKALVTARAIANHVRDADSRGDLRVLQRALPNDQIIVRKNGRELFTGPPRSDLPFEVAATARSRAVTVVLRDHHAPDSAGPRQISLMAGGLAALIIAEAGVGATVLTRRVRQPLRRAIETADRLAAGDLSARMGASGPEELARLGKAFDGMAEELERADLEQRRFLADLTHEIATPVSAVTGFAVALADGSAETDEERAQAAEVVLAESHRLDQLLQGARSLQRLDLFETSRHLPVALDAACTAAARRFRLAAEAAGVTLEVDAEALTTPGDEQLVATVLDNLVSNALRHTSRGGRITLCVRREDTAAVLAVRDTGEGIAPEHLERVFDRLYRADAARERATGGSGLGLAIARRAAHAMGGTLEVDSSPGAGSEFRLRLDLSAEVAPAAAPANTDAQAQPRARAARRRG